MDTGKPPPSPAPDNATTKRGRKTKLPVTDKIAALRAELAAAEAEAKQAEKAKAAIVGEVIIEAMRGDPTLAGQIAALLKAKVKSARDKSTIADLLLVR